MRLRTLKADGRHLLETHRGGEIEREEVTWPPTVTGGTVNGHRLQLPEEGFVLQSGHADGSVFVLSQGRGDGLRIMLSTPRSVQALGRYDLQGRLLWTVPVPGPEQVLWIGLGEGVVCVPEHCFDLVSGAQRAFRSTEPIPRFWPSQSIPDSEALSTLKYETLNSRLPEGVVEHSIHGLVVRGPNGSTTPALPGYRRAPQGQLTHTVELRWFEKHDEVVGDLLCGGEAVGFMPFEH